MPAGFDTAGVVETVRYLAATTVGAILAARRPRNPIGWLVLALRLALAAYPFVAMYVATGLFVAPGRLPWVRQVAWVGNWVWVPSHACVALMLLLFPDGRALSRRWRPVAWTVAVAGGLAVVAAAFRPGLVDVAFLVEEPEVSARLTNPLGVAALGRVSEPFLMVLLVGEALGAAALALRFRRSRGIERQQLKWVAYAAIAVAVLRYRLYEILLRGVGRDPPSWVVASATLAVAALFQPARRRIQADVDRRFNRRRYDAARTIAAFSARLRDQLDLDTLSAELLALVDQTIQPTTAWVWLRPATGPIQRGGT